MNIAAAKWNFVAYLKCNNCLLSCRPYSLGKYQILGKIMGSTANSSCNNLCLNSHPLYNAWLT